MKYTDILIDLDGTITDSKLGIINSIKYALNKFKIDETDLKKLTSFIGHPMQEMFAKNYKLSESDSKIALGYYREYLSIKGMYENELYPGMKVFLESTFEKGIKLFLATSKLKIFADRILKHFDVHKYFTQTFGSSVDGSLLDKTKLVKHIIDTRSLQKEKTIMIGDRDIDIDAAKNNGLDSVGVKYGYGSLEELKGAVPNFLVGSLEELGNIFQD